MICEFSEVNKENKALKRKLEKCEKIEEEKKVVEEQYMEALDQMRLLELEAKENIKKKESDVVEVKEELNVLAQKFEQKSSALTKAEMKLQRSGASAAKIRRLNNFFFVS